MKRVLFGLFVLLPLFAGCHSPVYTIEPFEAWAVDAESGDPIEGANVVATWALFEDGWHGHHFREMLEVKETVTDKNGRFAFPGFKLYNPRLDNLMEDPKIIIFKPGYEFARRTNGCGEGAQGDCRWATRIAVIAGQKVKMKKVDYSLAGRVASPLTGMQRDLYTGLSTQMDYVLESCETKKIPLFYQAIQAEELQLKSAGLYSRNSLPSVQGRHELRCGLRNEAFTGQKK
ncbi:MAG: carboxypeptidase-like regulatory domain-containing protein [Burkholderiales bacterium]|nr:carboxypeptidase-like regulatory domain-containing protein [Burkholderiales bacterium]